MSEAAGNKAAAAKYFNAALDNANKGEPDYTLRNALFATTDFNIRQSSFEKAEEQAIRQLELHATAAYKSVADEVKATGQLGQAQDGLGKMTKQKSISRKQ